MSTNPTTLRKVAVEIPKPDGSSSLYIGREVRRTIYRIVLLQAAWVANTGRRYMFMRGVINEDCEIEPYDVAEELELPIACAVIVGWPGILPQQARIKV